MHNVRRSRGRRFRRGRGSSRGVLGHGSGLFRGRHVGRKRDGFVRARAVRACGVSCVSSSVGPRPVAGLALGLGV